MSKEKESEVEAQNLEAERKRTMSTDDPYALAEDLKASGPAWSGECRF